MYIDNNDKLINNFFIQYKQLKNTKIMTIMIYLNLQLLSLFEIFYLPNGWLNRNFIIYIEVDLCIMYFVINYSPFIFLNNTLVSIFFYLSLKFYYFMIRYIYHYKYIQSFQIYTTSLKKNIFYWVNDSSLLQLQIPGPKVPGY